MSRSPLSRVRACWLGSAGYQQVWDLQAELVAGLTEGTEPETLLLLEHPHVFTMGKAAAADHVLWDEDERRRRGVDLIWSDRGGEATYHGPGQLVGYPVIDLARHGLTIRAYVEALEQSLIDYLADLGVRSEPGAPGLTGVWSAAKKVAAIGIKLNHAVVSHGFALNLTTDLDYFEGIIPCGHPEKKATSVEGLNGPAIETAAAARAYAAHFSSVFDVDLEWVGVEQVLAVRPVA